MPTHLFLCDLGWEAAVLDELARVLPIATHAQHAPGWIVTEVAEDSTPGEPIVALAGQCLPAAEAITAPSISRWVDAVGPRVVSALQGHEGPWRCNVFAHAAREGVVPPGRLAMIGAQLADYLKQKQRRLLRTLNADALAPFAADEAVVQIALRTPAQGALSICLPAERHALRYCLWSAPAGAVEPASDRDAPSRAFSKLAEVEVRLGRTIQPGETCVDLGASPGSWTYWALQRGAQVIALDRSPLRDDLMRDPCLTFIRGDAFRYEPAAPVDWLLCDVIAFPERTVELLDTWLTRRWCRQFCVTVKFRGATDYPTLEILKDLLRRSVAHFGLRRLTANKNEVTAFGGNAE